MTAAKITPRPQGWRVWLQSARSSVVLVEVDGKLQPIPKTHDAIRGRIVGSILKER